MRTKSDQKSIILIILIFAIVAAVVTVIVLSVKQDTVKENLKQDPVIKVLFVLEDKNQALFTDVLIYCSIRPASCRRRSSGAQSSPPRRRSRRPSPALQRWRKLKS